MANLLYITCNVATPTQSRTLTLGRDFLNEYLRWNPRDEVRTLDLYRDAIPRLDVDVHNVFGRLARGGTPGLLSDDERRKLVRLWRLADQFDACEKYVFVTNSLNLWFPAEFKMYVDAILIPNRTCRLAAHRHAGLLPGETKRSLHIHASSYAQDRHADFSVDYLRTILGTLGVAHQEVAVLERDDAEAGDGTGYTKVRRKLLNLAMTF